MLIKFLSSNAIITDVILMVINITVIIIFTGIKSNVEWAIRIKENKMLKAPALAGFFQLTYSWFLRSVDRLNNIPEWHKRINPCIEIILFPSAYWYK